MMRIFVSDDAAVQQLDHHAGRSILIVTKRMRSAILIFRVKEWGGPMAA